MLDFTAIDQFAETAADHAMQAGVDYVIKHSPSLADAMRTNDSLADSFAVVIRAKLHASLDVALADAKAAYDAGMGDVAMLTFKTSMVLAGVDAANVWLADQARR